MFALPGVVSFNLCEWFAMKRFLLGQAGSIGPLEGFLLAMFAIALIVGVRLAVYPSKEPAPPAKQAKVPAKRSEKWPELDQYEPLKSANPLRP